MSKENTFLDSQFNRPDYELNHRGDYEHNLVFIIMPFSGNNMQDIYFVIKDECRKLGLNAIRIDEHIGSGFIIREILDYIERAEFLICDLTYERPSVYYELGYAHGVGNEALDILLIAREGTNVHFDIAALRINYYNSSEHLRSIISHNLNQMIQKTRK